MRRSNDVVEEEFPNHDMGSSLEGRLRMENCHVIFRCGSFESGTAVINDHGRARRAHQLALGLVVADFRENWKKMKG